MFHIENRKKVLHGRSKTVPHPKSGWLKISYFSLLIQTQVWFRNDRNYMKINNIYRGMQIRPRRFDSGFGLHIRKPRRLASTGFFYVWDLMIASATICRSERNWGALQGGVSCD